MRRHCIRWLACAAVAAAPSALAGQGSAVGSPATPADLCARAGAPADHGSMDHAAHQAAMLLCAHSAGAAVSVLPVQSGQAAYAAIGEIVRMLDADSSTDWSKVNIESLRQHLIDMDDVTLHAHAAQRNVPGGVSMDVTGSGATAAAIRRMVSNHGRMLAMAAGLRSSVTDIAGGVRWVVAAADPADARAVARFRGLGFAGLLTVGEHHAAHHLALARGEPDPHGH